MGRNRSNSCILAHEVRHGIIHTKYPLLSKVLLLIRGVSHFSLLALICAFILLMLSIIDISIFNLIINITLAFSFLIWLEEFDANIFAGRKVGFANRFIWLGQLSYSTTIILLLYYKFLINFLINLAY